MARRRILLLSSAIPLLAVCGVAASPSGCAWVERTFFAPPSVQAGEAYADQDKERVKRPILDHSALGRVLKRFVDARGNVDYAGLKKSPADLDRYLTVLAKVPFAKLGRDQKLALLINAYNAFTLKLIIEHYPLKSIRDIPEAKRWKHKRWNLGGRNMSLDGIEHEELRKNFKEARIHFAVNCASIGCPLLRPEAYVAKRIDAQLADQARKSHQDPRWCVYEAEQGKLRLTRLYNWFAGDFEQSAGSVLKFVARHHPQLAKDLAAGKQPAISFMEYDWRLNSQ